MITALNDDFIELSAYIKEVHPPKLFLLVDAHTHEHCLPYVLANLETDIPYEIIEIEPGEELKTIETAVQLWSILAEFQAGRRDLLINIGGGVISDLGGFVASTYKRGIRFINVPTTLLAMCDASIGGKTGIDHQFLKNIVGTFALPEQIFLWPDFLKTLPFAELRSGFAEMLKHGLIADQTHWEDLKTVGEISWNVLAPYIARSMQIKQEIASRDFKEQNIRKTLNFGHTVGHALESLFLSAGTPVPHGEAVAAGMLCEAKISELEGMLSAEGLDEITAAIQKHFPKLPVDSLKTDEIFHLMANDKKNLSQNHISFSLIDKIGHCTYDINASFSAISHAFEWYQAIYSQK